MWVLFLAVLCLRLLARLLSQVVVLVLQFGISLESLYQILPFGILLPKLPQRLEQKSLWALVKNLKECSPIGEMVFHQNGMNGQTKEKLAIAGTMRFGLIIRTRQLLLLWGSFRMIARLPKRVKNP